MNLLATLFQRSARNRGYNHLLQLDDRLLNDIGLSRADIHQAIKRRTTTPRSFAHE